MADGALKPSGKLGEEFHFTYLFKRNRSKYVDKYYSHHPNLPRFCRLMNMTSESKNVKLSRFVSCILELF